ncbi:MAG: LexA family transcriptional regulator [Clostridium sp.]
MNRIFIERLSFLLNKRELSIADLSSKTGLSVEAISSYLKGKYEPKHDKIHLMANALSVSPVWLMGYNVDMDIDKNTNSYKDNTTKMPILGRIPAGTPIEAIEDIEDYLYIPNDRLKGGEYFLLKIQGNSMHPKYLEGDIVLFKKVSNCESGADCAVLIDGNDATLKKVYKYNDRIELVPLNPQYQVMIFNNKEIEDLPVSIIGIAISLEYRKLN